MCVDVPAVVSVCCSSVDSVEADEGVGDVETSGTDVEKGSIE